MYYKTSKDSFIVSSSLKTFIYQEKKINIGSLKELITNNYICHPNTPIEKVFKLEPSSIIISFNIEEKSIQNIKKDYFYDKKANFQLNKKNTLDELTSELEKVLFNAVEKQLISDVPIGSFLSGGIDSTLITAIASKVSNKNSIPSQ